jgi:hypothetical protein
VAALDEDARPGRHAVLQRRGRKLDSFADLPAGMRAAIEARGPIYKEPPPVDDQRPNETSWTYFKKQIEAARQN